MWWWRKIRPAGISKDLSDQLEQFGETLVAGALVLYPAGVVAEGSPLYQLIVNHRDEAFKWLTERRDIAERKEQRLETVEIAVLIFVVIGVAVDIALLVVDIGLLSRG